MLGETPTCLVIIFYCYSELLLFGECRREEQGCDKEEEKGKYHCL